MPAEKEEGDLAGYRFATQASPLLLDILVMVQPKERGSGAVRVK